MVRIRFGDEPSAGLIALALLGFANALKPNGSQAATVAATIVVAGVAIAVGTTLRRASIARTTELRLFAAPLYGKEVARAQALVPCAISLALPLVLLLAYRPGAPLGPNAIAGLALGLVAATLVALGGTLRVGRNRAIYVAAALALGCTIALTALVLGRNGLLVGLLVAVVVAYAALRAFGETLARFDPID
jgi:hypothetical protein